MSDTPQTDAAVREVDVAFVGHWGLASEPQEFVPPEFARELERENAALRDAIEAMPTCRCEMSTDDQCALAAENAALLAEVKEQCTLNAKGSEREYSLRGRIEQLERENAALWRDVYQCPPTSEYGYEGLKWADAFEVIERDNAELHNKLATLQHQTQWKCSCGGTDCEGQKENAALRESRERLVRTASEVLEAFVLHKKVETGHPCPENMGICIDLRAAIDAARKEAKP